jgi:ABC-type nitrate/sulfonate/bicarbonate transport system ATPase subunit
VLLELRRVGKTWSIARTGERVVALDAITLGRRRGRVSDPARSVRLWEVDAPQIWPGWSASTGGIRFPERTGTQKLTSMVFQEYALFPWRTVAENVVFGPEVRGIRRADRDATAPAPHRSREAARVRDALPARAVGRHATAGGARARARRTTRGALFDEPLAALDAQTRRVLQDELARIWAETGKTFIYVTHSLEEAVLLGSRIVLMTGAPGPHQGGDRREPPRGPGVSRARRGRAAGAARRPPARRGEAGDGGGGVSLSLLRKAVRFFILAVWQVLVQTGNINELFLCRRRSPC